MTTGSRVRSVRLPAEVEQRLRVVGERFGWSVSRALLRAVERGLPEFEGELVDIGGVQVTAPSLSTNGATTLTGATTYKAPAAAKVPERSKAVVTELRALVTETEQRMAPVNGVVKKHRLEYVGSANCMDCGAPRGVRSPETFQTMNCGEEP